MPRPLEDCHKSLENKAPPVNSAVIHDHAMEYTNVITSGAATAGHILGSGE